MIGLIWAQAHDALGQPVIGNGGAIPWSLPEDFKHFRHLTSGHPIIMGRKTWDSLPRKPLPDRTNIVLTQSYVPETPCASSVQEALDLAAAAAGSELVWVIGGASIYTQTMPLADRLEVTEIDLIVPGDTYAPSIPPAFAPENAGAWQIAVNGVRYRFISYRRKGAVNP